MKKIVVRVPALAQPLRPCPGFEKKGLATHKVDCLASCEFGCAYCSSDRGNYLRINARSFLQLASAQLGRDVRKDEMKQIAFHFEDVEAPLRAQLSRLRLGFGAGQVCVFSMLTDGFSPRLVRSGLTRRVLDLLLERTAFDIRILTKNAIVGTPEWLRYFSEHRERFIIGLSAGTTDDGWARAIEQGTSAPSARIRALCAAQDAGLRTYGMLCPCFPDVLAPGAIEDLVASLRPERLEHVWAEPFNDRKNWQEVRAGYAPGSTPHEWLTRTFEGRDWARWSSYATDLYLRLRAVAERGGWLENLRFLLYEQRITAEDAERLGDLTGVWLQSKPAADGRSQNRDVACRQAALACAG